ncbi:MAG: carboxypeptidase-like regulatory domain-containing protein [Cytophagales bacterium]|nr:carboxypeptidase-like regulatory domain-containing protein [Cytophagales bacterium]
MRILLVLLFAVLVSSSIAQQLTGKTLDEKGEPLPFATIHILGTTTGTTSNSNGAYHLNLDPGKYTIVVQYVGYQKEQKEIKVGSSNFEIDFQLLPEVFKLREVVVTAGENPADRVIREAIKKRKFYLKEVNAYSCNVYIKGLQRLDTFPEKILGIKLTLDTGIVYLSESISELKFMQPDRISERMISSKVSGNNQGFSWNQASDMMINMYEGTFIIDGLSERPFVSPIANNAFLFYDYELIGLIQEGDLLINKIKLLPKRATDPVFDGHIYIVEDEWRMHSVDALLTKSRGIEFVDSLTLRQVFAKADHEIWMPISQRFGFMFKVFGIKGSGHFNAVYSDYQIEPNYELLASNNIQVEDSSALFDKKDFTKEIMYVEEGSNEKDSIYWQAARPIPLSSIEVRDYHDKDSIRIVKDSKVYKDSVDVERNKLTVGKLLLSGYTIHRSYDEHRFDFPTILSSFQYNTVEGAVTNLGFSYVKLQDRRFHYRISPEVRYGFSNEKLHAKTTFFFRTLDKKFTSFSGGGGQYVSQINESNPVDEFMNTFNSLVYGRSFIKLFEKGFVYGQYQQEIVNGLFMWTRLEYANRNQLFNTSNYSFKDQTYYEPNQPVNAELADTSIGQHQALVFDLNLRVRFGQTYQTRPDRRIIYKPKTPELTIKYRKGLAILGSDVNFDKWELSIADDMNFGLVGNSKYIVSTGGFMNKKQLPFINYQHFNGNTLWYARVEGDRQYQLLDYYLFSTSENYLEIHYEHHFNEFLLNKIPLLRKLNWQAVASTHYLTTKAVGNYLELGVGIEHIFKFMRIDYFRSIQDGTFNKPIANQAIRFGVGF